MKTSFTRCGARALYFFLVLPALLISISASSQVSTNYTFTQSSGTYSSIAGGTVIANAAMANMDDFVGGPYAIGAPFVFDGVTYNEFYVSTNGFIAFGAMPSDVEYNPLSGTDPAIGIIAPFGADLDESTVAGTPTVRYRYVAPELIVQWSNYSRYGDNDRISFQVRLNTSNNQVKVVYGGPVVMDTDPFGVEVGLRGPNNTFPTNLNNREVLPASGAWVNSAAGTSNASTCDFDGSNPATIPAVGTTFIWSAPAVDISPLTMAAPANGGCYTSLQSVSVSITNSGGSAVNFSTNPVTVNCSVTGPNPMTFAPVLVNSGTLAVNATLTVPVSINYNMTLGGNYIFTATTSSANDLLTANDTMAPVTIYSHTPGIVASSDVAICTGSTTPLTTTASFFPYDVSFSNNTNLNIPDNTPAGVNQTITVSSVSTPPSQVKITINSLTHTFDGDLIFKITAPNGSNVIFCNQEGGAGANFTNTVFSDVASTPISTGTAPFTGTFLPDNPFSALTGSSNGNWVLNVSDNAAADVGTLHSWTISFTNANGIVSYTWTPGTGLSSTTVPNPTAFPTTTTNYTVSVTDQSGCVNSDQVLVTVNPLPTVTASVTPNPVCAGSTAVFTGGGASSYAWTGGVTDGVPFIVNSSSSYTVTGVDVNGCVNTATTTVTTNPLPSVTATASPSTVCSGDPATFTGGGATSYSWSGGVTDGVPFNIASTSSYTVTGTDANGCSNTATATVTANPLPTVMANSSAPAVCAGGSVTLSGSGATSYSWSGGVMDAVAFNPSSTNTYTVTGTDANGCMNTDMTTVTVNALPTVVANSSASAVCAGGSVVLSGSGATSYSWSGGVMDAVAFNPSSTNTYTVTGTDANGCMNTDMTTVTVDPLPAVTASSAPNPVCAGGQVTFTGSGATSYSWSGGVTDGVPFPVAATGTYTVTGTDANGCTNTDMTTVTVNPLPAVTANASAPEVCDGSSVTLTGSGATSYSWTGSVTDGVPFVPAVTATYTVTGTDANGCTNSDSVNIVVHPLPDVTLTLPQDTVCINDASFTLTGASLPGGTWSGSGVTGSTFDPASAGLGSSAITYTYTDGNGCVDSDTQPLVVDACTGIVMADDPSFEMSAYPNPTSGTFMLQIKNNPASEIHLAIFDLQGQVIYVEDISGVTKDFSKQIDLSAFANGTYFVKLMTGNEVETLKVFKQE